MGLGRESILRVRLPLYSVPEAGTRWYKTYHEHHKEKLEIIPSTYDPCLMGNKNATALVGLQTDDSLIAANSEFIVKEEQEIKNAKFPCKPIEKLTIDKPLEFNGCVIKFNTSSKGRIIEISQAKQCKKIKLVPTDEPIDKDTYVAQRARGAYIASVSQPQAAFVLSFAAQVTEPKIDDVKFLNKCLAWQMKGATLKYVQLDWNSTKIIAFTDSSFANNVDLSSQIGYVIVLADSENNANIIHWQSVKCRRITRSVLASELYAMTLGFDVSATIKSTLDQVFSGSCQRIDIDILDIPLVICVDSRSLYDCLVTLGTTSEKRLMIDIMSIRQSYERREISEIILVQGDKNPADSMTKEKCCNALQKLIETNRLELAKQVDSWVER
ncbi:hypothetical protein K3495_g5719 [Podosphaera aphanis]|nr:hypothetical protein K3495_g5719 [Podosphaera aphanis]